MNNSVAIIIGFRKVFSNVIVTTVTLDPVRCVTRSLSFTRQVTSIVTSEMCDRVVITPEPEPGGELRPETDTGSGDIRPGVQPHPGEAGSLHGPHHRGRRHHVQGGC